jgi:hypothetical protein
MNNSWNPATKSFCRELIKLKYAVMSLDRSDVTDGILDICNDIGHASISIDRLMVQEGEFEKAHRVSLLIQHLLEDLSTAILQGPLEDIEERLLSGKLTDLQLEYKEMLLGMEKLL